MGSESYNMIQIPSKTGGENVTKMPLKSNFPKILLPNIELQIFPRA